MPIPGWVQAENAARNTPLVIGQARPGNPFPATPPPSPTISNPAAGNARYTEYYLVAPALAANGFLVLPYNPNRCYLFIQNQGVPVIWVQQIALQAADQTRGLQIPGVVAGIGGWWEPWRVPVNAITISFNAAGSLGYAVEGTVP
jgi:hypothetical protein